MRLARGAPVLIGALFVLRVGACSRPPGESTVRSNPVAPSGSCDGSTISYMVGGASKTFACPGGSPCTVDVATGSAVCPAAEGQPPFRTCRAAADCAGAEYCARYGDVSVVKLGSPECVDGLCDWRAQTSEPCTDGTDYCYPDSCGSFGGSTTGGFPWEPDWMTGGATGNNGGAGGGGGDTGTGGISGTTSGGFPWGQGGVSGTTSGGFPWGPGGSSGESSTDASVDATDGDATDGDASGQ